MTKIQVDQFIPNAEVVCALKRGDAELQALVGKIVDAISEQLDRAAARLLADGIAADRLMMSSDAHSRVRSLVVDGVIEDGILIGTTACTVSTKLTDEVCYEVELVWFAPYEHLAACDPADDAAKVEAMRKLVP